MLKQFAWRGVQYTWNQLPQVWKCSSAIWHGLIQAALEQGEALEHLQCINLNVLEEKSFHTGLWATSSFWTNNTGDNDVALGLVWTGQDVKKKTSMFYTAAGESGPTQSLWQKAPGETRGHSEGFWSWGYGGSKAHWKRDIGSIWRGSSCFGSDWYWNTSPSCERTVLDFSQHVLLELIPAVKVQMSAKLQVAHLMYFQTMIYLKCCYDW